MDGKRFQFHSSNLTPIIATTLNIAYRTDVLCSPSSAMHRSNQPMPTDDAELAIDRM